VAYKTRSIIPGVIAHALFDFVAILLVYFIPYVATQTFFKSTLVINCVVVFLSASIIWISQEKITPTDYDKKVV